MGGVGEEREGRWSVFDESEGEAVADGFVGVVHVEFFQDVLAVGVDGVNADGFGDAAEFAAHFCAVFPDVNCTPKVLCLTFGGQFILFCFSEAVHVQ